MTINLLAVLFAAVAAFLIGGFWYSPQGFSKAWVKAVGFSAKDIAKMKKKSMKKPLVINFLAGLLTAFVLANFVNLTGATTAWQGVVTAAWLWLGFIATTTIGAILWEGKPAKLWFINNGYHLLTLTVMGAILGAW
jgi:hypothetical protein